MMMMMTTGQSAHSCLLHLLTHHFWAGSLDACGASSFINSKAYQWCGQLRVQEPVECA
jgi:hypothetical protein